MEDWKADLAFNNYQMVFILGPFDKLVLRNCIGRQHTIMLVVVDVTCWPTVLTICPVRPGYLLTGERIGEMKAMKILEVS